MIKKIPGTNGLVTTIVLTTKISEVENKIPCVSALVKKTDSDSKVEEIQGKESTTGDYNKFISDILDVKIKQKELVKKSDIDKKLIDITKKFTWNKTKLIEADKKTNWFNNKSCTNTKKGFFLLGTMYFAENDGYQNFLVLAPVLSSLILDSNKKSY